MVRPNGAPAASAAAPPASSSSTTTTTTTFSAPSPPAPHPLHHRFPLAQPGITTNPAASDNTAIPFVRGLSEGWTLPERPHTRQAGESSRVGGGGGYHTHARSSSLASTSTRSTRSSSFDLGRKTAIATATTAVKIRPVLHVNPKSVPRSTPTATSSPQRRIPNPPSAVSSSSTPTPLTSVSDTSFLHARQAPSIPTQQAAPPVLPDLELHRPESDDFSNLSQLRTSVLLREQRAPSPPPTPAKEQQPRQQSHLPRTQYSRAGSRNRAPSQKAMLGTALQKAHMAVTLDNLGNFEGALEAYQDACALLSEVMSRAGGDNDRVKLQTIKDAYMERMDEIRALPRPAHKQYERDLPPRPTEDFADGASLYTDDDESTLVPSYAPSLSERSGAPPRRDSLYHVPDNPRSERASRPPPLPLSRTVPSEYPGSALLSPVLSPRQAEQEFISSRGPEHRRERDSFTFGAAALSPRFSPSKAADYGIQRSVSNGSSRSSQSHPANHSRQGSEEVSTSWLNTIDESGSSVGEPSPLWARKSVYSPEPEHVDFMEDDFDAQLDAAVEAVYEDGYVVDYNYDDRDEEELMIQSPRENVERAKERVRQVEREMEMEIQKDKERRLQAERERNLPKPSDLDFYDDVADDEYDDSEEERMMVEEMTRGYTLDFDFDLDKTALPRESTSTQYSSDGTLGRGSMSSGYSSGTTWVSGHITTSTSLTTVAETPTTPPPLPPPVPPEEQEESVLVDICSPTSNSPPPGPPPSGPPPPLPMNASQPGLAVTKPGGVRSRRLSSLAEPPEPLTIETSTSSNLFTKEVAIPTTIVQGPSPLSAPANQPPPIPMVSPLNIGPKSPGLMSPTYDPASSRPGTSHDQEDTDNDAPLTMKGSKPLTSQTVPNGGFSTTPLHKTFSNDSITVPGSESPARIGYTPKVPGVPSLRQIHSSASLRSRNLASPEMDTPATPKTGLFSSSSTSNLRKGFPRSATPAAMGMTSLNPLATAGLPQHGMNLFDSKIHSPTATGNATDQSTPAPLEPCPPEPLSRPFWLMRCLYQTIAHPRGGYVSTKLFVPREVWYIKGVKLKAIDEKINACDLVTAALQRLAAVKQDQVNSVFEEMQTLEGVLDRASAMLSKKLGNEVGSNGARALYGESSTAENHDNMVTTKVGSSSSGGKYFSLRKLRTKTSSNALGSHSGGSAGGANYDSSYTSLPMAGAGADASQQPKRDIDSVAFGGPNANYIAALAKLFDAAQILDRLMVFDEEAMHPQKVPIKLRIGLELSHRHAAEFFGFFICRFALSDVSLLLDKFVKRGSEWVSQ